MAIVLLAASAITTPCGSAAELRLRPQCTPAGAVVTLGDVAEISSADARQAAALAAIELFPAPPAAEEKVVRVREIQDLLLLRGVNLTQHQFSGSSEVNIQSPAAGLRTAAVRLVSKAELQRIKRRLQDALVKFLDEQAASKQAWSIEFELTEANARLFADPVAPIQVAGGVAPWTGKQQFDFAMNGHQGPVHAAIEATVRLIPPVVVALRPLGRGMVIREGDVALQNVAAADKLPARAALARRDDWPRIGAGRGRRCRGHIRRPAAARGRPSRRDSFRARAGGRHLHPHQRPRPRRWKRRRTGRRRVASGPQHLLRPRPRRPRGRGLRPAAASGERTLIRIHGESFHATQPRILVVPVRLGCRRLAHRPPGERPEQQPLRQRTEARGGEQQPGRRAPAAAARPA